MPVIGGWYDPNSWPTSRDGGLRTEFREPGVRYLMILLLAIVGLAVVMALVTPEVKQEEPCRRERAKPGCVRGENQR